MSKSSLPKSTSVSLASALLFALVSYGLVLSNAHDDTLLVFGLAPTAFCAFAAFGWMRLRTILITESVLVALWLVRHLLLDLSPTASFFFGVAYYAAIAAVIVALKVYDSVVSGRDAKLSA